MHLDRHPRVARLVGAEQRDGAQAEAAAGPRSSARSRRRRARGRTSPRGLVGFSHALPRILQSGFRAEQSLSWQYAGGGDRGGARAPARSRRRSYGQKLEIRHKGEIDLVTEVDRACEDAILATIRARFPDHDIVTEETDIERTGLALRLVRRSRSTAPRTSPTATRSSAPRSRSTVDGELVAGAVYDPIKDELFTAERGGGAHLNGRRLQVSAVVRAAEQPARHRLSLRPARRPRGQAAPLQPLHGPARAIRRDGAAALDLCYVAAGRIDGFWEERLQPWDVMAGALIDRGGGRPRHALRRLAPRPPRRRDRWPRTAPCTTRMLAVFAEDRAARIGVTLVFAAPCRSGGTGRRAGLKILCRESGVWVRPPPPAPTQQRLRASRWLCHPPAVEDAADCTVH